MHLVGRSSLEISLKTQLLDVARLRRKVMEGAYLLFRVFFCQSLNYPANFTPSSLRPNAGVLSLFGQNNCEFIVPVAEFCARNISENLFEL